MRGFECRRLLTTGVLCRFDGLCEYHAVPTRKIIVNIATSAEGYIARVDGNLEWLTRRPTPKGFYGLPKFSRSIAANIIGRKTYEMSVKMGASFSEGRPLIMRLRHLYRRQQIMAK